MSIKRLFLFSGETAAPALPVPQKCYIFSKSGIFHPDISASFCFLESCLMAYSLAIASSFVGKTSQYTSFTGRRLLVYFAPAPRADPFFQIIGPTSIQGMVSTQKNIGIIFAVTAIHSVFQVNFHDYLLFAPSDVPHHGS